MAKALQKHIARRQDAIFADWCGEVQDLAGESWPDVSDQAPTLYAVWEGGASAGLEPAPRAIGRG